MSEPTNEHEQQQPDEQPAETSTDSGPFPGDDVFPSETLFPSETSSGSGGPDTPEGELVAGDDVLIGDDLIVGTGRRAAPTEESGEGEAGNE